MRGVKWLVVVFGLVLAPVAESQGGYIINLSGSTGSSDVNYSLGGSRTAGNSFSSNVIPLTVSGTDPFQFSESAISISGSWTNENSGNSVSLATIEFYDLAPNDFFRFFTSSSLIASNGDELSLSGSGVFTLQNATFDDFTPGSYSLSDGHVLSITSQQSSTVPEPSSFALFGLGAMGMAVVAVRRRRKQTQTA